VADLLVISNGKGEDYVAARVLERLRELAPGLSVQAFPLVGLGEQLAAAGLEVVGPRKAMPSGGFTMHSAELLRRDVRAGLIGLTLAQARFLLGQVPRGVFVVGDVYAQAHASLVRAPRRVLQTLVSVHHGGGEGPGMRWFMEGFRPPEMWLLRRAQRVYARDQATADWLARARVPATWLGNPMMDGLAASPLLPRDQSRLPVVALLPGSRGQASASLAVMRRALELASPVVGVVAWAGSGVPERPEGWVPDDAAPPGMAAAWRRGERRLWVTVGRFPSVLASADAVLGTAGTANEQAVGLGLPVVAFPVPPFYGEAYMRNQKRLLEGGLLTCEPLPERVAAMLELALSDEGVRERARRAGAERMGPPGASEAIARDLASWLGS
jgi:uncharacterized protein (TIGR03492 family)